MRIAQTRKIKSTRSQCKYCKNNGIDRTKKHPNAETSKTYSRFEPIKLNTNEHFFVTAKYYARAKLAMQLY